MFQMKWSCSWNMLTVGKVWLSCKSSLITSYVELSTPGPSPSHQAPGMPLRPLALCRGAGASDWIKTRASLHKTYWLTDMERGSSLGVLHCPYMETQRDMRQSNLLYKSTLYIHSKLSVCLCKGGGGLCISCSMLKWRQPNSKKLF